MLRGTRSQGRKRAQNRTRLPVTTAADQTVAAPRSGKPPLPRKPRIASGALLPSTSAPVPLPRWGLNLPSRHPSHTGRGKKTSLQGSHRISSFLRSSSAREGEKRRSSGECSCPPVSRSAQHHQCGAPHQFLSQEGNSPNSVLAKDGNIGPPVKKKLKSKIHPHHFKIMHMKASAQERKGWIVLMCWGVSRAGYRRSCRSLPALSSCPLHCTFPGQ